MRTLGFLKNFKGFGFGILTARSFEALGFRGYRFQRLMDSYGFGACGLKGSGLWSAGGAGPARVESGFRFEFEEASATAPNVSGEFGSLAVFRYKVGSLKENDYYQCRLMN